MDPTVLSFQHPSLQYFTEIIKQNSLPRKRKPNQQLQNHLVFFHNIYRYLSDQSIKKEVKKLLKALPLKEMSEEDFIQQMTKVYQLVDKLQYTFLFAERTTLTFNLLDLEASPTFVKDLESKSSRTYSDSKTKLGLIRIHREILGQTYIDWEKIKGIKKEKIDTFFALPDLEKMNLVEACVYITNLLHFIALSENDKEQKNKFNPFFEVLKNLLEDPERIVIPSEAVLLELLRSLSHHPSIITNPEYIATINDFLARLDNANVDFAFKIYLNFNSSLLPKEVLTLFEQICLELLKKQPDLFKNLPSVRNIFQERIPFSAIVSENDQYIKKLSRSTKYISANFTEFTYKAKIPKFPQVARLLQDVMNALYIPLKVELGLLQHMEEREESRDCRLIVEKEKENISLFVFKAILAGASSIKSLIEVWKQNKSF